MSYKATIEFGLHLHEFNNVDLFQQGIYYLRLYLHHKDSKGKIIYAQPYNQIQCEEDPSITSKLDKKLLYYFQLDIFVLLNQLKPKGFVRQFGDGQIEDELFAFSTQKFPIRYCEETVPLNIMCFWRSEVDAYPDYANTQFTLTCELMCADFSSIGQCQNNSDSAFKQVSIFECQVNNSPLGIHEYIPIQFAGHHYCQAEATFHTILLVKEEFVQQFFEYYVIGMRQGYYNLKKMINQLLEVFPELRRVSQTLQEHIPDLPDPEFYPGQKQQQDIGQMPIQQQFSYYNQLNSQNRQVLQPDHNNQQILQSQHRQQPNMALNSQPYQSVSNQVNSFQQSQYNGQFNQSRVSGQPYKIPKISTIFKLTDFKQMDSFAKFVLSDMNIVSGNLFQLWNKLLELLRIDGDRSIKYLKSPYILRMKEKWGELVSRDKFPHDITQPKEKKTGKQNENTSNILRQKLELMIEHSSEPLNLVDLNLIPQTDMRPFLLEEIYTNPHKALLPYPKDYLKKSHVIVLCHGFQGNSFDMRLMKNNLYLMYPDALFLSSKANEEFTNGNIADTGRRLANEVTQYIKEWCPGDSVGRLSFIGHSLGGVIIRAALPHLSDYSDRMFLYMSLSSPHLGYMYNSSKLIEAGIWFLKTTRKSECLTQLHMSDAEQLADCYLYKLANQPGLNWFRNIALLSSYQDQYVPFESARIQKCDEASNENQKGRIYNSMVDNLLGQLRTDRVHRIDVNFKIKDNKTIKKTIDNMIGRSAHIQFLESDALAKTLVYCFNHLFA